MIGLTRQADSSGYAPEWFVTGYGENDVNSQVRLLSTSQWAHAFGIPAREIDYGGGSSQRQEGYRACKDASPDDDPDNTVIGNLFPQLEQIANGIQLADPKLTPDTFEHGMFRTPRHAMPRWAITGAYGPSDYSFADAVGEIWWDPGASSDNANYPGALRWVRDGKRYLPR